MNEDKCKRRVHDGSRYGAFNPHQCTRKLWKDGFCKIHHPESIKIRNKTRNKKGK